EKTTKEDFFLWNIIIFAQNKNQTPIDHMKITFASIIPLLMACTVGSQIAFFISDTGIGIAKEKISVIFERFRQGDEGAARQYGGNGLGLSIANELVKQMGGRIEVQSTENVGSTFTFYIPYQKAGLSQSKNLLK
ncbi:MAG: hypothetical protein II165_08690, partial [Bacteroidales bacterium]|nr:hypothetical protein [Bacteroidales bacterium]